MPNHAPRSLFAVPAPVAALFRRFPLAVLPPNELPLRAPARGDAPVLYVFIADEDAPRGRPSFNPSCLKWQTFLKISGVHFRILPSTNHASPSGALPYLQPPIPSRPIPAGSKLEIWALSNSPAQQPSSKPSPAVPEGRQQAYHSLLETRVRTAWLHALYLSPANRPVLQRLYITPASNNPMVRLTLLRQVTSAAEAEVLKSTRSAATDPGRIYADARSAFEALEAALLSESRKKSGEWFFGSAEPGLFDASVFAYTQLLLDERFGWVDETLPDLLREFPALVRHRDRLLAGCFPELA
ncbi:mitochondrial outer membrane protein [Colletotrichum musicola]|uniref:Mitochondrial outer membrane protein n=1 Tax=Colletotrichum musicola TaxID=2175873 RepID=A0A8H6N2H3_9PEZI|nr:mitochondrial outer membrane protein [Colletotrichum musicola]